MEKKSLKINFSDFWGGFERESSQFYRLLQQKYELEISENPDILFYSCYGNNHLKYNCHKIYYAAENFRPNFKACDLALTFDFLEHPRHMRFPLYWHYIDAYKKEEKVLSSLNYEDASKIWLSKSKFCCMVVSNPGSKERIDFFHLLSKYKKVDSGGRYLNNVGGPVLKKINFISDYRFVFAFENNATEGYTTEKVIEPLLVDSIPIYWGNPKIELDINTTRIVHIKDVKDFEKAIEQIIYLENNPDEAIKILMKPIFANTAMSPYINNEKILNFLYTFIEERKNLRPVSKTFKGKYYILYTKTKVYFTYILHTIRNAINRLVDSIRGHKLK